MNINIGNLQLIGIIVLFTIIIAYFLLKKNRTEMFSILSNNFDVKHPKNKVDYSEITSFNIKNQHFQQGRPELINDEDVINMRKNYYKRDRFTENN
mgnify:CR=1 FL=1|jgi:hypothetical protein